MEKYIVLQNPSLDALNDEINKLADKYAPVGNLIYANGNFIQQVELTEEGEELIRKEEALGYVVVSDEASFREALISGKEIFLKNDLTINNISKENKLLVEKPSKINLKGHKLTLAGSRPRFDVKSSLEVSNGEVEGGSYVFILTAGGDLKLSGVKVSGNCTATVGTSLNPGEVANIEARNCELVGGSTGSIVTWGGNVKLYNSTVIGKGYYGISATGNSSVPPTNVYAEDCIISNENKIDGAGIYFPAEGSLYLKGCDVSGAVAAYIKCGDVRIAGGKYSSLKESVEPYAFNNNGFVATGDIIVCDACNYPNGDAQVAIVNPSFGSRSEEAFDIASYKKSEDYVGSQKVNVSVNTVAKKNF